MLNLDDYLLADHLDVHRIAILSIQDLIDRIETRQLAPHIPCTARRMSRIDGMHFHMMPETFIQLSGRVRFNFPESKYVLQKSDTIIVPRGVPHRETVTSPKAETFRNLVIMFMPDRLSCHIAGSSPSKKPTVLDFVRYPARRLPRIAEYINDAIRTVLKSGTATGAKSRGLLIAAYADILDIIEGNQPEVHTGHKKIILCKNYIMSAMTDPTLTVQSIALWLGYSADYLSALFREETGERLVAYINRKRIEHGKRLLCDGIYNISEIAYACGYNDPGYFTRMFRKMSGHTPSAWRLAGIGDDDD